MGETTAIPWCDHTFNWWIGCTKRGPECAHCYAEGWGKRFGVDWGPHAPRRRTSEENRRKPFSWDRAASKAGVRRRVFCSSLSDVFEDNDQLVAWRQHLMVTIDMCQNLDWMLLTKRPENVVGMVPQHWLKAWPIHVWVGVTAGTQRTADTLLPKLREVPAHVRFVSGEPLLERVSYDLRVIHQLIIGCESGPNARHFDLDWMRDARDQAEAAGCAFFAKQIPANNRRRATDDLAAFPQDLRTREFPTVTP